MNSFYLKNLLLHNYRSFADMNINLNKKMNVVIGKNSSGKTTILEAAAVMLGAYLAAYGTYVPSRYVYNISKNDPLLKPQKERMMDYLLASVPQYPCVVGGDLQWGSLGETVEKVLHYKRMVAVKEGRTKFDGNNPMQGFVKIWEYKMECADGSDKEIILPIVLYLSSARLWNEDKKAELNEIPIRTDGYRNCLAKKHGMQFVFDYIKIIKNIANEENPDFNRIYQRLMEAVKNGLKDEIAPYDDIIYSSRYNDIAIQRKDKLVIKFDALSDGYRNVIKIILDIAVRMCILNPYLKENALEQTPGVVLIDEIDLSLHPTWQRRIIRILKETFPKVQFICATHSPYIIQSLQEGELIKLSAENEDGILYSGKSIEDISENVMEVSDPRHSEKQEEMYQAAKEYFDALGDTKRQEELPKLKKRMDLLSLNYSDNPAYIALIEQKYLQKKMELENENAPGR